VEKRIIVNRSGHFLCLRCGKRDLPKQGKPEHEEYLKFIVIRALIKVF
jgi:hypothetical protein